MSKGLSETAVVRRVRTWLVQRFPLQMKVTIRLKEPSLMPEALGWFWLDDGNESCTIWLRKGLGLDGLVDTLFEEWAHARTCHLTDHHEETDDPYHHPTFWAEYGRIVKAWRQTGSLGKK